MAKKKANSKLKLFLILGVPLLQGAYSLIRPYFAETKKIQEETKKLEEAIKKVKSDEAMYSPNWEDKMKQSELQISSAIPDKVVPSEILRFFATNFEKNHPGVEFTSLLPQQPVIGGISAEKEDKNVKVRVSKLQIKAKMPAEHLFPYLEYVESYKGMYRILEVNFNSIQEEGKKNLLNLDMNLELFLTPKDWLPKTTTKTETQSERGNASVSDSAAVNWFETESLKAPSAESLAKAEAEAEEVRAKTKVRQLPKPPKIWVKQFVGSSIIVGEKLFEVGDQIEGWSIASIDSRSRSIILRKEKSTFKVVVP